MTSGRSSPGGSGRSGVNLVRQNDGRQYLPWDDARYEKYKKE